MRQLFAQSGVVERGRIVATLVGEVNALLGLELAVGAGGSDSDFDFDGVVGRIVATLGEGIAAPGYAFGEANTLALISALASDRQSPVASFLEDTAEILFLERARRSEYTARGSQASGAPPYLVRKLLLEYALHSRRLDELVATLMKGFCATRCDKPPIGCCHILGYDLGLVPEAMLGTQRLEARRNGWIEPVAPDVERCRYHTDAGCVLALFKSPACIGYLCEALTSSLREIYAAPPLREFLERLAVFRSCDLDRKRVFLAMDATIRAGQALLYSGEF
ncbi:MAG: hypothetical protein ABI333_18260 [bacterium]